MLGTIVGLAGATAAVVSVTVNKRKNRELLDKLKKGEKQSKGKGK